MSDRCSACGHLWSEHTNMFGGDHLCPDIEVSDRCCHLDCDLHATWAAFPVDEGPEMNVTACDQHLGTLLEAREYRLYSVPVSAIEAMREAVDDA